MTISQASPSAGGDPVDLIEWYFEQGWTDGFPVVPPTPAKVDATIEALGGNADEVEARVPPRWGTLTREILATNMVMAGCQPTYAPVVRTAMLALCSAHFNLNGVQATTHMAAPLVVVNGPIRAKIGMNAGANVFGSGNRANATIGRAIRLILLNVGGAWPGDLDKSTLGHPGKYSFCIAENEQASPWAPYHVEQGFGPDDDTVFCIATEGPHSVTNHVADDPEGVLDSLVSAMSTIAHNNAVSSGSCAVVIGPEHAVKARAFHIEDLSSEWQNRLILSVASLLGVAAGVQAPLGAAQAVFAQTVGAQRPDAAIVFGVLHADVQHAPGVGQHRDANATVSGVVL